MLPWKMPFLDLRLHKKILVVDGETRVRRRPQHRRGERDREAAEGAGPRHSFSRRGNDRPADRAGVRRRLVIHDRRRGDGGRARRGWSRRVGGSAARTIAAGPDQEVDQLVLVLLSAINLARRSIRIATPYFLPDEQLITALQLAVAARRRSAYRLARAQQPSPGRLGGPDAYSAVVGDGLSSLAQCAAVRPFEIDDDRWQLEPHRQRELGHAKPSPEFRTDRRVLRYGPGRRARPR